MHVHKCNSINKLSLLLQLQGILRFHPKPTLFVQHLERTALSEPSLFLASWTGKYMLRGSNRRINPRRLPRACGLQMLPPTPDQTLLMAFVHLPNSSACLSPLGRELRHDWVLWKPEHTRSWKPRKASKEVATGGDISRGSCTAPEVFWLLCAPVYLCNYSPGLQTACTSFPPEESLQRKLTGVKTSRMIWKPYVNLARLPLA